ncbi:MAG: TRAP transporter small permease [Bacillota bacterium]|nr:TRAP transporter small permease [Bacillota bacterium]
MKNAEKFVYWLSETAAIIGTIVLVILMTMTVYDVLMRTFFNETLVGAIELTEMMMPIIGFLGIAWCALQGGHVSVDILISSLSEDKQRFFDILNYLLAAVVTFLIGWFTLQQGIFIKGINVVTDSLDIPKYPFMIITALGFFLMTAASLALLIKTTKRGVE